MRNLTSFLFLCAVATQLGATNCGEVIRDSGFELWCGDELCAWKVTRGEVRRVPTWHEADSGVELVGTDAAIQQLSPVDSYDGTHVDNPDGSTTYTHPDHVCIEFSLLANIEQNAIVDLIVDVNGDGSADHTQRLPTGSWQRVAYPIRVRHPFAGIRFELAKAGAGRAMLGNIGGELIGNCQDLPLIDPRPVQLGSPCDTDDDCTSGICGTSGLPLPFQLYFLQPTKVCLGCDTEHPCGAGMACGVGDPLSPVRAVPTTCVPEASQQLGEQCLVDAECASGICSSAYGYSGLCAGCRDDSDCTGGQLCRSASDDTARVCGGGAASGAPCGAHADCASGVCAGSERSICDEKDNRACSSPAQCPFGDGLQNTACTTVGIQGGICQ